MRNCPLKSIGKNYTFKDVDLLDYPQLWVVPPALCAMRRIAGRKLVTLRVLSASIVNNKQLFYFFYIKYCFQFCGIIMWQISTSLYEATSFLPSDADCGEQTSQSYLSVPTFRGTDPKRVGEGLMLGLILARIWSWREIRKQLTAKRTGPDLPHVRRG